MASSTATELRKSGSLVRIYLEDDRGESALKLMTSILEVSLIGKLVGINPFNQPAVEKVKIRVKKSESKCMK